MATFPRQVFGSELQVYDVVEVWWNYHKDTIVSLVPYHGPLEKYYSGGAQIAKFLNSGHSVTIANGSLFTLLGRNMPAHCHPEGIAWETYAAEIGI